MKAETAAVTSIYPYRLGPPTGNETTAVRRAMESLPALSLETVAQEAVALVAQARDHGGSLFDVQSFLQAFPIGESAGVNLLRLAEAMPRTRDAATQVALLADKLTTTDWRQEGSGGRWFDESLRMALTMAKTTLPNADSIASGQQTGGMIGKHIMRPAANVSIGQLGKQFVFAESVGDALSAAAKRPSARVRYSLDMLGEGARTWADAKANLERYRQALDGLVSVAKTQSYGDGPQAWVQHDGLSIKLSAIHPRYELAHYPQEKARLLEMLIPLLTEAAAHQIGITIDAEEVDRLELHIDLFAELAAVNAFKHWAGLGLAVQAYQLRSLATVQQVVTIARQRVASGGAPLAVRLVKGAYWDAEIKRAQELGIDSYPVFTHKSHTDLSYIACAWLLLQSCDVVFPQFATHNAITAAWVLDAAKAARVNHDRYEFQRLHGMGDGVHAAIAQRHPTSSCRVYAPVGDQTQLLAYLIRRMLENGASTSFVRKLADSNIPAGSVVSDEITALQTVHNTAKLPLPTQIFLPRKNAKGVDLGDSNALSQWSHLIATAPTQWHAQPRLGRRSVSTTAVRNIPSAANQAQTIGSVQDADATLAKEAIGAALAAFESWQFTPAHRRAELLEQWADLLEDDMPELVRRCVWEAGKTLGDAIADVREAVDFCRYYASQARKLFDAPTALPGPTGESNELTWHPRGVFVCISPWNFPVAIFIGQVAAALAAGNTVLAKPAEQTCLTADRVIELLLRTDIADDAVQLLPGGGDVGAALTSDPRIGGVVFTGSNATAKAIQRSVATHHPGIIPLIAETGGLNGMIVDSTALPEQVIDAVVSSSFRSAGQRCSALRVLFVQNDIADGVVDMLKGALQCLTVGEPSNPACDVGPVIDQDAYAGLSAHLKAMQARGFAMTAAPVPPALQTQNYIAPTLIEVDSLASIGGEQFGPILHVIRFERDQLEDVVRQINQSGFGLTFGVHSRLDARARWLRQHMRVGNIYVNRNIIGAVVGVQPFGGEGLSGTGPKAGGPSYLPRFAVERTYTVNTAAAGGNLALLASD